MDIKWINLCLTNAKCLLSNYSNEVPCVCLIVFDDKQLICNENNKTNETKSATSHAEILALCKFDTLGYDENKCVVYVSSEPCVMCAAALRLYSFQRVVFASPNSRFGGCVSLLSINSDSFEKFGQKYEVVQKGDCESVVTMLKTFYRGENLNAPDSARKKKSSKTYERYFSRLSHTSFGLDTFKSKNPMLVKYSEICSSLTNSCEDINSLAFQCSALLDFLHEVLHTGLWHQVDIEDRRLYYLLSAIYSLVLIRLSNLVKSLYIADMGIIMGSPCIDFILSDLAEDIHSENFESTAPQLQRTKLTKCHPSPTVHSPIRAFSNPGVTDFMTCRMSASPALFKGMVDHWPALSTNRWSIDYIRRVCGQRTVPVELGARYTDDSWSQRIITVNELIDLFEDESAPTPYLAQHQLFDQIRPLQCDIAVPEFCYMNDDCDLDNVVTNAWFGPAGTVSPLHTDPKHNLFVQVMGTKYIRLYAESESALLYPYPPDHMMNNTSQVDVEHPDLEKFPSFTSASFVDLIIGPGDMLYIPPKTWHFVRSLETSFSVSFWFT